MRVEEFSRRELGIKRMLSNTRGVEVIWSAYTIRRRPGIPGRGGEGRGGEGRGGEGRGGEGRGGGGEGRGTALGRSCHITHSWKTGSKLVDSNYRASVVGAGQEAKHIDTSPGLSGIVVHYISSAGQRAHNGIVFDLAIDGLGWLPLHRHHTRP